MSSDCNSIFGSRVLIVLPEMRYRMKTPVKVLPIGISCRDHRNSMKLFVDVRIIRSLVSMDDLSFIKVRYSNSLHFGMTDRATLNEDVLSMRDGNS